MVDVGRRVTDDAKVFQEEALAVIHPLTGPSCLNKNEHGSYEWILCA